MGLCCGTAARRVGEPESALDAFRKKRSAFLIKKRERGIALSIDEQDFLDWNERVNIKDSEKAKELEEETLVLEKICTTANFIFSQREKENDMEISVAVAQALNIPVDKSVFEGNIFLTFDNGDVIGYGVSVSTRIGSSNIVGFEGISSMGLTIDAKSGTMVALDD